MVSAAEFPLKRYLPWVAGAGLFGLLTWYVAQEAVAQLPWWGKMPWGLALIFFLGGFVGTLYADCINANSSLRNWWQRLRAVGCFGDSYTQLLDHDLGSGHGGRQRFRSICIPFSFRKHVTIDTVRLTSQIHRFDGRILQPAWASYTWKAFENTKHHRGDTIDIVIAHVPEDFNSPGVYGDLDLAGYYLTAGSAHIVTIEIFSGKKPQTHEVLIVMPGKGVYGRRSGRIGDADPGGRFLVFQEGTVPVAKQSS